MHNDCLHDCTMAYVCPFNETRCDAKFCNPAGGYPRPFLSVNRQLPGPMICACEGDTVKVDVFNGQLGSSDSTTIHWHGMYQKDTPHMDGTPYVSQCPIPNEQAFRYHFTAFPPGTHWYHSHMGIQRFDGLAGPLIVLPRGKRNDIRVDVDDPEKYIMFVQDWLNEGVAKSQELQSSFGFDNSTAGDRPYDLLINGKGYVNGKTFYNGTFVDGTKRYLTTPPEIFHVKEGESYRFRLIHAGATACPLLVFIPNHAIEVIATDGMPVKSRKVDILSVMSGERYDFILKFPNMSNPIPIFVVYLSDFTTFEVAFVQEKEGKRRLKPPYPNTKSLTEKLCGFFDDVSNMTVLNPAIPISRGPRTKNNTKTIPDQVKTWCQREVTMNGLRLTDLQPAESSSFEPTSGLHKIMAEKFGDENPEFPLAKPPLSVELSSYGGGHEELSLFRFQLNNISYRSPPLPALFYNNSQTEFCNISTIMSNQTASVGSYAANDDPYYWCPHSINLQPMETIEIVLVSRDSALLQHPIHMHGHSFAVVAMAYENDIPAEVGDLTAEYLRDNPEVVDSLRLEKPVRKDTVVVPCE